MWETPFSAHFRRSTPDGRRCRGPKGRGSRCEAARAAIRFGGQVREDVLKCTIAPGFGREGDPSSPSFSPYLSPPSSLPPLSARGPGGHRGAGPVKFRHVQVNKCAIPPHALEQRTNSPLPAFHKSTEMKGLVKRSDIGHLADFPALSPPDFGHQVRDECRHAPPTQIPRLLRLLCQHFRQHLLSRNGCFVLALRHLNLEHFNDILGHSIEWWALPRARGREAQWLFSGFWFNDSLHTFNAASIRWLISSSSSFEPGRKLGPLRSTIIQLCPSWGRTTCCVVWS